MTKEELFEAYILNAKYMLGCGEMIHRSSTAKDRTRWDENFNKFDVVMTDIRDQLLPYFEFDAIKLVAAFEEYNDKRRA